MTDLDALADRLMWWANKTGMITDYTSDLRTAARIVRAVAAAPIPGWVVAAEFPDDRYRVTRTDTGWALWTSDEAVFT
jgi:hypothetical protein